MGSVATVLKRLLMVRCPIATGVPFGAAACVSVYGLLLLDLLLFLFPFFQVPMSYFLDLSFLILPSTTFFF